MVHMPQDGILHMMYASHQQTVEKLENKISSCIIMTGQERNYCEVHFLWTNFWNKNLSMKYTSRKNNNFLHLKLLDVFH
jgi:hypothetical protein